MNLDCLAHASFAHTRTFYLPLYQIYLELPIIDYPQKIPNGCSKGKKRDAIPWARMASPDSRIDENAGWVAGPAFG